jgi:ribosomal protein S16
MRFYTIRIKRKKIRNNVRFEFVVMFKDRRPKSFFFERLGVLYYSPKLKHFCFNLERLSFWLLKGSKINPKVGIFLANLLTN